MFATGDRDFELLHLSTIIRTTFPLFSARQVNKHASVLLQYCDENYLSQYSGTRDEYSVEYVVMWKFPRIDK